MIDKIKDFLIKYDNYLTAFVLFVVLIVGVSFPQKSDNGLRAEVDNLTYQVDLANFNYNQLSSRVNEAVGYTSNLTKQVSDDFYKTLTVYNNKLIALEKNIAFVMTNMANLNSSISQVNGLEGYNSLVDKINILSQIVSEIQPEVVSLREAITGLGEKLKSIE